MIRTDYADPALDTWFSYDASGNLAQEYNGSVRRYYRYDLNNHRTRVKQVWQDPLAQTQYLYYR